MSSSTLTLYRDATHSIVYSLASQGKDLVEYRNSNSTLSEPQKITVTKKIGAANSKANDHVVIRAEDTGTNATTGLKSTGSVVIDISIPRDTAAVTSDDVGNLLEYVCSLFQDAGVVADTRVNINKLLAGLDV